MTSNKPYIVKAFYNWISDNQLTPYIVVDVTVSGVMVPMSYVQNGEIVLNIAHSAVGAIALADHAIEFSARFGGKLENLYIPYGAIAAIYAKENGAGTALAIEHNELPDEPENTVEETNLASLESVSTSTEPKKTSTKKKPALKIVK